MSPSQFKKHFQSLMAVRDAVAVAKDVWFMPWSPGDECITAIHLQKSDWSKLYYVNLSVFARGAWGWNPPEVPDLWQRAGSTVTSRRLPKEFDAACDLTSGLADDERARRLADLFDYLDAFRGRAKLRSGLRTLAADNSIRLTPPALAELDKLDASSAM